MSLHDLRNDPRPSWQDLGMVFGKIGLLSFGGPAAQIALMHRVLVEERAWLSEKYYLNALGFCIVLPGPEAMQLATYAGWRLRGVLGGLLAGGLFIVPGASVMLALAWLYAVYGDVPMVAAVFQGVKAAILIVVLEALTRVAKRSLKGGLSWTIAGMAFLALYAEVPYPLVIVIAALAGGFFLTSPGQDVSPSQSHSENLVQSVLVLGVGGMVWIGPLILAGNFDPFLAEIGQFFATLAVVTFGGAYAVLAFMAQDVVGTHAWLTQGQMMDGLGLTETTPGPLILVTQFVGFLAGYQESGLFLALLAQAVTLWVTFVPCFLWIFAGAPHIDWINSKPRLAGALAGVMAAVVGVILKLSLWFALHTLFDHSRTTFVGPLGLDIPVLSSLNPPIVLISLVAGSLVFRYHMGLAPVLAVCAGLGAGFGMGASVLMP